MTGASAIPTVMGMPLVTVKVVEGLFSEQQKARLIGEMTEVVLGVAEGAIEVEGGLPEKTWVLVEEVGAGDWGIGGRPIRPTRRPGAYIGGGEGS